MFRPIVTRSVIAIALIAGLATRASAQNPFSIDGIITDTNNSGVPPGALKTVDPNDGSKELGPVNGSSTKIGVINTAPLPMLGLTNPNGQVDLNTIYTQTATAVNGDIWFYFAWARDSNTGSGFLSIEFEQAPVGPGCNYANASQASLIANCNPWANRQAGDFVLLWDQQGNDRTIYKRVFSGPAGFNQQLVLGPSVALGSAVAQFSADNFRGEAAVNLTADVFTSGSCQSFANTIPGTVTGNSDTADYKDTVLSAFPPVSNCGSITVTKYTLDPSGVRFSGTGTFPYTIVRADGSALRFVAEDGDTTTTITRTLTHDGDSRTHVDLIGGTNYTLTEDTATMGPQWTLVSIVCTLPGDPTAYPGTGFPVVVTQTTSCIITNKFVKATPTQFTVQTAKALLWDSVTITGISPTTTPATSVTFNLYSDASCTTQVGSAITATITYSNGGTRGDASTLNSSNGIQVQGGTTSYWRVTYPGDALNNGFTTACGQESTTVTFSFVQ
jgi:hypothetical protein